MGSPTNDNQRPSVSAVPIPVRLNLDVIVRGALAASAIGFATTIVLLECLYILIAVNADNAALKKLGVAHQSYAVISTLSLAALFDVVFLPFMFFATRAYLRSYWKMALFSSALWVIQIAWTSYHWQSAPNPTASIPGDLIAVLMLGYLAVRWRQIRAQG